MNFKFQFGQTLKTERIVSFIFWIIQVKHRSFILWNWFSKLQSKHYYICGVALREVLERAVTSLVTQPPPKLWGCANKLKHTVSIKQSNNIQSFVRAVHARTQFMNIWSDNKFQDFQSLPRVIKYAIDGTIIEVYIGADGWKDLMEAYQVCFCFRMSCLLVTNFIFYLNY